MKLVQKNQIGYGRLSKSKLKSLTRALLMRNLICKMISSTNRFDKINEKNKPDQIRAYFTLTHSYRNSSLCLLGDKKSPLTIGIFHCLHKVRARFFDVWDLRQKGFAMILFNTFHRPGQKNYQEITGN